METEPVLEIRYKTVTIMIPPPRSWSAFVGELQEAFDL
jgi:hypothetical protein